MQNVYLEELLFKIGKNKDKKAFIEFFDYFAPRIIGYLIKTGTLKEISEEIAQEVLTTVWQKAEQFDSKKANVVTWIFTITKNKKIDRIRKNENPDYNSEDLIQFLYSREVDKDVEIKDKITEILGNLENNEKKLIKMNFFEGKTHKNIARELEIPLGTVKSKLRNILNKLKN